MFKLIFYIIIGYLAVKVYKYFKKIFTGVNSRTEEPKVHQTADTKRKINEKDIIDAKFEEIEIKENPSSK